MFLKQAGAGLQAVYYQSAQKNRCNTVTRNSQGQHGDQCSAGHTVICSFRCNDTVGNSFAELLRMLRESLGLIISKESCNVSACGRNYPNKSTDNA